MSLFGGVEIPGHPDLENLRKLDLLPVAMIRSARRIGIGVDREYFHALTSRFLAEMRGLEKDIANYIPPERLREFAKAGTDDDEDDDGGQQSSSYDGGGAVSAFNAGSPEQVGKLMFDMLGIGEGRRLKRTEKGGVSTGKKQLETLRLDHPVVPLVLRFRQLNTLVTRYTAALPKLARLHPRGAQCPVCELPHKSECWRVHGEMGTTRADTGRINHKNPNLSTIPVRSADGRDVQAGFIAPEGMRLVVRDLGQIELRGLSHLANAGSMIRIYQAGGDIHDHTARKIFKLVEEVKPDKYNHRLPAKRCIAKGQRVLTKRGAVPIETVGSRDLLWDGQEWVAHQGVVWRGKRPTIGYLGLRATLDHEVWAETGKMTLTDARRAGLGPLRIGVDIPVAQSADCVDRVEDVFDIVDAGPRHRFVAEGWLVANCNFSIVNGTTEKGLYLQLVLDYGENRQPVPAWLTESWCNHFIVDWLDIYPEVREFFDLAHYRARRYGLVWEPFGRVKLIPEVKSTHAWIRESGLRQAQNFPVTSLAAGQLKLCMGATETELEKLRQAGVWCHPLLSIHDAIMVEAEEDWAQEILDVLGAVMDTCMDDSETGERLFRVPIQSDGYVAQRWEKQ